MPDAPTAREEWGRLRWRFCVGQARKERGTQPFEDRLDHFAQIHDQMESISDLDGMRGTLIGSITRDSSALTTNHLDFRVLL